MNFFASVIGGTPTMRADEAALSGMYGVKYYREASESGIKQGRAIAQFLLRMVHLKSNLACIFSGNSVYQFYYFLLFHK
jgi:hypothetical protein